MKKLIKVVLFSLLGLLVLGIAALLIIPQLVNVQKFKPEIEARLTEASGLPVTLGDELNLSIFPWVGISFSGLSIGNPQGFSSGDMVRIGSFEAHLKVMPLLSKEVEIDRIVLDGPELYLEKSVSGQANWSAAGNKKEKVDPPQEQKKSTNDGSGLGLKSLDIGELSVQNGVIQFHDKSSGVMKSLTGLTLRLKDVSFDKPMTMDFSVLVDGKPFALQGDLGPLGNQPGKGNIPFTFTVSALEQVTARLRGAVDNVSGSMNFKAALEVEPFSPRAFLNALEFSGIPETSDPSVLTKFSTSIEIEGSAQKIEISKGSILLDDSNLTFTGGMPTLDPVHLVFYGELDSLDLDRYLPPRQEGAEEKVEKQGGSVHKQTDYSLFRELLLESTFAVSRLKAHGATVENMHVGLSGREGVFNLEPFSLDLYQGSVDMRAQVNVQGEIPMTAVKLNTAGLQVGPLLHDFAGKDLLEGVLQSNISLEMKGDTPDKIKQTLNGSGDLVFRDGAIVGVDLAGMVRNVQTAFGGAAVSERPKTDFTELNAPFTITDGLFNTQGIALKSPFLRVMVKGNADLVAETLDMRVHPKFVAAMTGQGDTAKHAGLLIPVIVAGTFQEPEFSPDVEEMVKSQVVDEGLNKVLEESGVSEKIVPKDQVDTIKKGIRSLLPSF